MKALIILVVPLLIVALIVLSLSIRVVTQYEKGVLFRLGKVVGVKDPGLAVIIPVIDRLMKVSLRIVTMPIQSQGIITRDNVSVDVSAVAYFRVVDAVKSVIAIENVHAAINQIAQTTLRKVVGQHTLDQALSETDTINARHPNDPRRRHPRMGCRSDTGRAQRHPVARQHEACDGSASRGRAREARQNYCGRRRIDGRGRVG